MRFSIFPGWWQVFVAMLGQAISIAAVFTAFSIIVVPLQEVFGSSRTHLMMAMTLALLVCGAVNPLLGAVIERYSLRSWMLAGAVLLVIGFLGMSFTTTVTQVLLIYAVFMSTATVLLGPLPASVLLARWFHRRRGLAMGLAASGTAVGGLLLPPLLQGLLEAFDWRTALRLFSAILFAVSVPVIVLLTVDRPSDRQMHPDGDATPKVEGAAEHPAIVTSTVDVLRHSSFWFISTIVGITMAGVTALIANLVPLVIDRGISAESAALLLSTYAIGNFAGKMLFAGVADRVDLRLALVTALVLQEIALLGFLYADSYALLAGASLLVGLSVGGILPLWSLLVARVFGPGSLGRVMGMTIFVVTAFSILSPLLFGVIFDMTGGYQPALIANVALLTVAMALLPRIRASAAMPVITGEVTGCTKLPQSCSLANRLAALRSSVAHGDSKQS